MNKALKTEKINSAVVYVAAEFFCCGGVMKFALTEHFAETKTALREHFVKMKFALREHFVKMKFALREHFAKMKIALAEHLCL